MPSRISASSVNAQSRRRDLERAGESVLLRLHDPRVPRVDGELETGALGDELVAAPDDARCLAAPVEAWLEPPLEPHRTLDALDPPCVLDPREQTPILQ